MNNNRFLEDKVAVITGAGSGIGKASALLLAAHGATIATIDHRPESSEEVAEKIAQTGGKVVRAIADISQPDAVQNAMEKIMDRLGQIDIVFANAGVNGVWAPVEDLTIAEWQQTLDTNLNGTFFTIKYAVPHLKQRGGAIIINSSINGTRVFSTTGATAYACSKAAQVALAKMLALELTDYQIRVNVICPGEIETGIGKHLQQRNLDYVRKPAEYPRGRIPLTKGKAGTAEQVAQLVLFLASDAASHITGTEIWIDGAESLLRG